MLRHWIWRNLLQVAAGILLVMTVSWLVTYSTDRQLEKKVKPGWVMARSPGNLQTLALYQGDVWAGGINGLFRFETEKAERLPLPRGSSDIGVIHDLLADRAGNLWVGHEQGVSFYNGSKWERYDALPTGKRTPVTALLEDKEGNLWMGLPTGVFCSSQTVPQFYELKMGAVDVLYQDRLSRIWAGSSDPHRGGLACYDGREWKYYTLQDGLVHSSVACVTETADGTLWIGTGFANAGGANYLSRDGTLKRMTKQDGLAGDKVRQIYQDRAGNIWFCSEYDGVAIFKDGRRLALLTTNDGLAGQEVKKVIQDQNGVYWLATEQGLNRIVSIQ